MAYVALRCDLASHNWSLKLAAANEKNHFWPLVLKHKQISQYSTLICLLVYRDMTWNLAIKTALFANIKTAFSNEQINCARVEPTSLCAKEIKTRSLHPLCFHEVLCRLLMSFVKSEIWETTLEVNILTCLFRGKPPPLTQPPGGHPVASLLPRVLPRVQSERRWI